MSISTTDRLSASSRRTPWKPRPRKQVATILDLGMKLHIPYNNDFRLISAIEPYAKYLTAIYLPCDIRVLGSGRFDDGLATRGWDSYDREIDAILARMRPLGIDVNMLLNASYVPNEEFAGFTASPLYDYLQRQLERGIRWVTISNIELARRVRQYFPDLRIDVSAVAMIDSVRKAVHWKNLTAPNMICIDLTRTRDPGMIRDIQEATGIPCKIIANSQCMSDCPSMWIHQTHQALREHSTFDCWPTRAITPWYGYKDPIVPPYYLRYYEGLIADVKLIDRSAPTDDLVAIIRHYAETCDSRDFLPGGGVGDEPNGGRAIKFNGNRLYYDHNCKHPWFKPLPEKLFLQTVACDKRCNACDLCYEQWRKDWSVVESLPDLEDFVQRKACSAADATYYRNVVERLHAQRHNVPFVRELKRLLAYCAREMRDIPHSLLAIAFAECGEPELSQAWASRVKDAALRASLDRSLAMLRGKPVLRYLDFDAEDRASFFFVDKMRRDPGLLGRAALADFYITVGETAKARPLLRSIRASEDPDHEIAAWLLHAAFEADQPEIAVALAKRWGADPPSFAQLIKIAGARHKLGQPYGDVLDLGRRIRRMPEQPRLHVTLRTLLRSEGSTPLVPGEADTLLAYAIDSRRERDFPMAHDIVSLLLEAAPHHVSALRLLRDVLLDMNRRDEAAAIEARIAEAYASHAAASQAAQPTGKQTDEQRLFAQAETAFEVRDYDNSLILSSRLARLSPSSPELWTIRKEAVNRLELDPLLLARPTLGEIPPRTEHRPWRSEVELEKVKKLDEFRNFVGRYGPAAPRILPMEESQHFYYVRQNDERVGFVELRYAPGMSEAMIPGWTLDPDCEKDIDRKALLGLVAERARRMGAVALATEVPGAVGDLVDAGWNVLQTTTQLGIRL